jgi:hypothetical protein
MVELEVGDDEIQAEGVFTPKATAKWHLFSPANKHKTVG